MIITGHSSAVTVAGLAMPGMGEYSLKIGSDSEEYEVLEDIFTRRIPTDKKWDLTIKMKGSLPARNYGAVVAGSWTGQLMKTWKGSVEAKSEEAPQQANVWLQCGVTGVNWSIESEKFVDSVTKHVFLKAVAASNGLITVTCPLISGQAVWGDGESAANSKPMEEKMDWKGSGIMTAGTVCAELVARMLYYNTQIVANRYVDPDSILITRLLSGQGFLEKIEASSDGKTLDIDVSVKGYGEPTLL